MLDRELHRADPSYMADGDVIVKLDEQTARRLSAAAASAGQSVDDYVRTMIVDMLDEDWAEDLKIAADYDQSGVSHSVEEGLAVFDNAVARRFEAKR